MKKLSMTQAWIFAFGLSALLVGAAYAGRFDDSASGDWDTAATWTLGDGVDAGADGKPSANDHIDKDDGAVTVTVTADESFGDADNESRWDAGNITINPGCVLTHDDPDPGDVSAWEWYNNSANLDGGGIFVNRDSFRIKAPGSGKILTQGGGTITTNEGTIIVEGGGSTWDKMGWKLDSSGDTFVNQGTLILRDPGPAHNAYPYFSGAGILHNDGGTIQVDRGTATGAGTYGASVGAATFNNDSGSIRVEGATLSISSATSQLDGGAIGSVLTSGSYTMVDPDGTNTLGAVLNWDGSVGANKFTTLGSSATVSLSGPHARFDAVEALDTVAGVLSLQDGNHFTNTPPSGTFSVDSTGVIEFGLHAPDSTDPALTTNALMMIDGSISVDGTTQFRVVDSGGIAPGDYVVMTADSINTGGASTIPVELGGEIPRSINHGELVQAGNTLVLSLSYKATGTVFSFK